MVFLSPARKLRYNKQTMPTAFLSQLSFHIPVTPTLLCALLALMFALWIVYSIILRYHWKNYGSNQLEIIKMNVIYFVGSGILIAGMVLFAFLYSL